MRVLSWWLAGCGMQVVTVVVDDFTETVVQGAPVELPEDLPPGTAGASQPIEIDLAIPIGDVLAEQGIEEGDLSSVVFRSGALQAAGGSLAFLHAFALMVDADGQTLKTVAELPPGDAQSLELDTTQLDLVDYLWADDMLVVTEASGELPPEDVILRLSYLVEIGVTLRGALGQL